MAGEYRDASDLRMNHFFTSKTVLFNELRLHTRTRKSKHENESKQTKNETITSTIYVSENVDNPCKMPGLLISEQSPTPTPLPPSSFLFLFLKKTTTRNLSIHSFYASCLFFRSSFMSFFPCLYFLLSFFPAFVLRSHAINPTVEEMTLEKGNTETERPMGGSF